jgi:hypothetical protein
MKYTDAAWKRAEMMVGQGYSLKYTEKVTGIPMSTINTRRFRDKWPKGERRMPISDDDMPAHQPKDSLLLMMRFFKAMDKGLGRI